MSTAALESRVCRQAHRLGYRVTKSRDDAVLELIAEFVPEGILVRASSTVSKSTPTRCSPP
jgi:hypothetical protein